MRTFKGVVLLVISQGLIGCNGSRSSLPLAPSTVSQPMTQPAPATDGTMIAGTVADTAFRPLAGAIVEVVDGPQAGMTTTAATSHSGEHLMTRPDSTRRRKVTSRRQGRSVRPAHPVIPTAGSTSISR